MVPGVLQIEAMAQASGLLLYQRSENFDKLAYLIAIDKTRFRKLVVPGDQLRIEAELVRERNYNGITKARALVAEDTVAEAEIKYMLVDKE